MGIYDRDYYRRDGPSYIQALMPSGKVCIGLIIVNVVVFVAQFTTKDLEYPREQKNPAVHALIKHISPRTSFGPVTDTFILDPAKVFDGQVWRLLTYAFLHDNLGSFPWHITFNMLFLWMFGGELERMFGPKEFLAFYLAAALVGGLAYTGWSVATHDDAMCLGASGAVTAVLILAACHFPQQVVYVFFVLPMPIWLFAIFNIGRDAGLVGLVKTETAVAVHLGGAAFAAAYFKWHWHLLGWWPSLLSLKLPGSRPRLRVYRPEKETGPQPVSVAAPLNLELDEHLEAKLDAVLEKVARLGQKSLTENERQILLRASEIYKRKRS